MPAPSKYREYFVYSPRLVMAWMRSSSALLRAERMPESGWEARASTFAAYHGYSVWAAAPRGGAEWARAERGRNK